MQALTLGCINLDLLVCFCGGRGWKQLYSLAALSALSFLRSLFKDRMS